MGDRYIWWHVLYVIVPSNLNPAYSSNATLWIGGNSNTGSDFTGVPGDTDNELLFSAEFACGLGMVAGTLFQTPNQPIVFASDPLQEGRTEDAIIAFTWDHFLQDTSDPTWLVRFPMVRGAVRALDAMSQYTEEELGTRVEYFSIAGASKRGWTTWLMGAVEPRVKAITPIVLDAINFVEVEHHEWQCYEGWTYQLEDYYEMDIMTRLDIPEMRELQEMVDPYFYRDRLTLPKFVVNGVMDEFQHPDDTFYWWDDMPSGPEGPDGNTKWFLLSPNTEHSFITGIFTALPSVGTWISYLLNGWEIPYLTWSRSPSNGDITFEAHNGEVLNVTKWYSYTCDDIRRDYRVANLDDPCPCGFIVDGFCANLAVIWHKESLNPNDDSTYTAHMDAPTDGKWGAFLVEVQMSNSPGDDDPMHTYFTRRGGNPRWPYSPAGVIDFTTEVSIVPDTFPYEDCYLESCHGELL